MWVLSYVGNSGKSNHNRVYGDQLSQIRLSSLYQALKEYHTEAICKLFHTIKLKHKL